MVFKVGLTGGIASGKSTVGKLFQALGTIIIDADIIARNLLNKNSPYYRQIIDFFGDEVLLKNEEINRAWLRERIFTDLKAKQSLESMLHPEVKKQILEAVANCEQPYCIISIPLLVEAKMQYMVDRIAVVNVDEKTQLSRLIARDGLNEVMAMNVLRSQCRPDERLAFADDLIDNTTAIKSLIPQIKQLHEQYLKLSENIN